MTKIAFIGLGTMGGGMAARLLGAGFPLTVYNRTAKRAEKLQQAGARLAGSPAEAAQDADIVITMVADDKASREVWEAVLPAVRKGTVLIDCSTLTPGWVRELATLAAGRGCPFLEAPVTGSRPQAANGELLFLVGGDAEVLEKCREVLKPMSRGVVHLGANGAGATMKLINNFLCGAQAAALAEAMVWIERSGLDKAAALGILTGGAPGSPLVKGLSERMNQKDVETNFRVELMAKDLAYAIEEGRRLRIGLSTGVAALLRFEEAMQKGLGDRDMSAVVEPLR